MGLSIGYIEHQRVHIFVFIISENIFTFGAHELRTLSISVSEHQKKKRNEESNGSR